MMSRRCSTGGHALPLIGLLVVQTALQAAVAHPRDLEDKLEGLGFNSGLVKAALAAPAVANEATAVTWMLKHPGADKGAPTSARGAGGGGAAASAASSSSSSSAAEP